MQADFRVNAAVQFFDERGSSAEMIKILNDTSFRREPEMILALVPACVSLQITAKFGLKLVAQAAASFCSVEHVFCNFVVGMDSLIRSDLGLFLSQWLRSIERDGLTCLAADEAKIISLIRDLLLAVDSDADTREPMSVLLLTILADQFEKANVWGSDSFSFYTW